MASFILSRHHKIETINWKITMIVFPKDDAKYRWTNHVKRKMAFYGLSGDRIKRVIRNPKRSENGIAENTIAVMSAPPGRDLAHKSERTKNKKMQSEIWVMYATKGTRKVIITAWRYPGISPIRDQIPIPADILKELKKEGVLLDTNSLA